MEQKENGKAPVEGVRKARRAGVASGLGRHLRRRPGLHRSLHPRRGGD